MTVHNLAQKQTDLMAIRLNVVGFHSKPRDRVTLVFSPALCRIIGPYVSISGSFSKGLSLRSCPPKKRRKGVRTKVTIRPDGSGQMWFPQSHSAVDVSIRGLRTKAIDVPFSFREGALFIHAVDIRLLPLRKQTRGQDITAKSRRPTEAALRSFAADIYKAIVKLYEGGI